MERRASDVLRVSGLPHGAHPCRRTLTTSACPAAAPIKLRDSRGSPPRTTGTRHLCLPPPLAPHTHSRARSLQSSCALRSRPTPVSRRPSLPDAASQVLGVLRLLRAPVHAAAAPCARLLLHPAAAAASVAGAAVRPDPRRPDHDRLLHPAQDRHVAGLPLGARGRAALRERAGEEESAGMARRRPRASASRLAYRPPRGPRRRAGALAGGDQAVRGLQPPRDCGQAVRLLWSGPARDPVRGGATQAAVARRAAARLFHRAVLHHRPHPHHLLPGAGP